MKRLEDYEPKLIMQVCEGMYTRGPYDSISNNPDTVIVNLADCAYNEICCQRKVPIQTEHHGHWTMSTLRSEVRSEDILAIEKKLEEWSIAEEERRNPKVYKTERIQLVD